MAEHLTELIGGSRALQVAEVATEVPLKNNHLDVLNIFCLFAAEMNIARRVGCQDGYGIITFHQIGLFLASCFVHRYYQKLASYHTIPIYAQLDVYTRLQRRRILDLLSTVWIFAIGTEYVTL